MLLMRDRPEFPRPLSALLPSQRRDAERE